MNKIRLIIEREYMTRVKRKSFLLTTLLVPLVIVAFYAIIIAVSISGESNTQSVAILDEANLFNGKIEAGKNDKSTYSFIHNETEQSFKHKYKKEGYSLFLYIPPLNEKDPAPIKVHSQSAVNLFVKSALERKINVAIERKRLVAANIDPEIYKNIKADIEIENAIDSGKGEQKSIAGVAYAVSFIAGILIYMILLIYGTMVMRGVMEEKTNRIAEVIVSSATGYHPRGIALPPHRPDSLLFYFLFLRRIFIIRCFVCRYWQRGERRSAGSPAIGFSCNDAAHPGFCYHD